MSGPSHLVAPLTLHDVGLTVLYIVCLAALR